MTKEELEDRLIARLLFPYDREILNIVAVNIGPVTEEVLAQMGWEKHPGVMVLKSTPRLGWLIGTHTLIIGYADTGVKVEHVGHMIDIMQALGIIESVWR